MKRFLPLPCLLLILATALGHAEPVPYYHTWKLQLPYDGPIEDIEQWAADNFADKPDANIEHWALQRQELDIDGDGVVEIFIRANRLTGNGGGPILAFQRSGKVYRFLGHLGGRSVERATDGPEGEPRVQCFSRISSSQGYFTTYELQNGRLLAIGIEEMNPELK